MIKKYTAYILIAFLLGIAIFTSSQYVLMIKKRHEIVNNLQQIKIQLSQLESEKETLNQKLTAQLQEQQKIKQEKQKVEETLRISQDQSQKRIEELNTALTVLREENTTLQQNWDNLTTQVEQLSKDKTILEARLGSIKELKKAIRELKKQMRKVKTQLPKKSENENLSEGNRGYIIKDGLPTYPQKVKIEVTPAP